MKIACTAKARELLKSSEFIATDDVGTDFFSWHTHVYLHQRRKILLLINDLTGFPVVLYRPKAAQLKGFESVATDAIREAFLEYGVKPEHVDRYFEAAGQVQLVSKTSRSVLSRLTEWKDVTMMALNRCAFSPFDENRLTQPAFARKAFPITWTNYDRTADLITEAFFSHLNVAAEDLYEVESLELQVQLMLEKHHISRRIVVPANCTLDILHRVIKNSFGWGNHHQHQFLLMPKGSTWLYNPTDINIYSADSFGDLEFMDENKPFLIDAALTIKKALELPYDLWYEHDLGDSWAHQITLVATHRLPKRTYQVLEAIGDVPPDDVGGESGYEEFLAVMVDKNHIDHENFAAWYEDQTSHRMSMERLNRWLDDGWFI